MSRADRVVQAQRFAVVAHEVVEVRERESRISGSLLGRDSRSASSAARPKWTIASWLAYIRRARSPARTRYSIAFGTALAQVEMAREQVDHVVTRAVDLLGDLGDAAVESALLPA